MLNKWVEANTEATWNELHEAIANLPVLSGDESSKRKEVQCNYFSEFVLHFIYSQTYVLIIIAIWDNAEVFWFSVCLILPHL